ncbi:branched-chain amino acid ABC transporter permease [Solwaraspora sp. WMMD1047]|uniref:branched-chain amino acid ABC transporter permease n=1 Tax=Solwaraspora sp. WMMD1047 TaxID=3016102 RepID=UPI0024168798|nr:branched-chain amino acid ABC transporter permease [Solwaraspora sp. WMMD1047]MDG4830567.1 branched-chain amino acid ABC transporter permease [Solwaraspora sp. WMMD1047]
MTGNATRAGSSVTGSTPWAGSPLRLLAPPLLVVAAVAPPFLTGPYAISTLTQVLAFSLMVMSMVLLMGVAGMPTIGQAGFFGVGGYATGLLASRLTTNSPLLLLISAVAGMAVAALTGWLLVRVRGTYLLMLTLAIGELLALAAIARVTLTGGSDGLANIPTLTLVPGVELRHVAVVYWYIVGAVLILAALIALLIRSPFGAALRGIRDNEPRMRALGYSTARYKYAAFCVSGGFAGMAGSLWVTQTLFIAPADMSFHASALALLALIVGGAQSLWGAVAGSALIIVVQNMLPISLQGLGPVVLGAVLILVVYLLPDGISGLATWRSDLAALINRRRGGGPAARRGGTERT